MPFDANPKRNNINDNGFFVIDHQY